MSFQQMPLWSAQQGKCFHCGEPMDGKGSTHPRRPSREHVYPVSKNGNTMPNNIVLAHQSCNEAKGDREPTHNEIERTKAIYALLGRKPFIEKMGPTAPRSQRKMVGHNVSLGTFSSIWPKSEGDGE